MIFSAETHSLSSIISTAETHSSLPYHHHCGDSVSLTLVILTAETHSICHLALQRLTFSLHDIYRYIALQHQLI